MKTPCHQQIFCLPHPAKVFAGAFLVGYYQARGWSTRKKKPEWIKHMSNKPTEKFDDLMRPPYEPLPHNFPEVPADSSYALLLLRSKELKEVWDGQPEGNTKAKPEIIKSHPIHYNYNSIDHEYSL